METADKLISVIVPVYKVEQYLNKCVESIVNQTYKNLEIILVDDGSPDACPQICDAWAQKDSRIKVIHKENGGASSARNAGLDAATGDYIAFVDGDDYLSAETYETLISFALKHGADIVRCGIVRESANGRREVWGDVCAQVVVVTGQQLLCDVGEANGLLPVSPCNKLFNAQVLNGLCYDTAYKYAEDVLFNFLAAEKAGKAVYFDVPFYHYINNENSASHRAFDESRFDEHRVDDILLQRCKEYPEVYRHCVKGDVMKSFRTIKEMSSDFAFNNRFGEIRKRIIDHKFEIFKDSLYSKATKIKTLLLWLCPPLYKLLIKMYVK